MAAHFFEQEPSCALFFERSNKALEISFKNQARSLKKENFEVLLLAGCCTVRLLSAISNNYFYFILFACTIGILIYRIMGQYR